MNWSREKITLNDHAYFCNKSGVMGGAEGRKMLNQLRLSTSDLNTALFIQWIPAKLRPIDENDLAQGYVSDDDPDAHIIWKIDNCSFIESLDFAFDYLGSPKQETLKKPDPEWTRIKGFLVGITEFSSLHLDFVCESHVGFLFSINNNESKREAYLKILSYKKENFQYDGDAANDRWLFNIFNTENRFSLGVA